MPRNEKSLGYSFTELLLVVVIIGVISGIAIPAYLGQRARARLIGDAQSNAQALRMQLETLKADTGTYGTAGAYTWTSGVPGATAATLLPSFTPGSSKMNMTLTVGATGLTYTIAVADPSLPGTPNVYKTDQTGASLALP
jgi:type II secretory pathway pseudopilin PulG